MMRKLYLQMRVGLSVLIGVAVLPAIGRAATPADQPLSAATQASIGREAGQMLREPGVTHVGFYGFTVDRAGHVLTEWVVRPSGSAALDRTALAAIRKAVLRRMPANAPARMRFVIPIAFRKNGAVEAPALSGGSSGAAP